MSELSAEGFEKRNQTLDGWPIGVVSYKIGDRWICKVDNVSPGAIIARGDGPTREEAEREALEKAGARLATTRKVTTR